VVKYFAIRRSLLFEKTLFDELRDGLRDFRRPFLDAGVEHPPMKDAVDGVLCIRMPGQIVENFWRWRRKSWVGEHTLKDYPACSIRRALHFWLRCERTNSVPSPLKYVFGSSSENTLRQASFLRAGGMDSPTNFRKRMEDNFVRTSRQIFAGGFALNLGTVGEDNFALAPTLIRHLEQRPARCRAQS
jgi:hypothetical protein